MSVRFGINPIVWSNDDLRSLGGSIPLEQCLSEARQAGYEGVELGHKFPRQAGPLGEVLEEYGLDLVSGWYSTRLLERDVDAEIRAARGHVKLLAGLGCEVMIVAETSRCVHGDVHAALSSRPVPDAAALDRLAQNLDAFGAHLADEGLQLVYHHHMGTVIQTSAEIDGLLERTGDDVGLLLDTGHLTYAGADPLATAKRWGERIAHVHLKDVRRPVLERMQAEDAPFLKAVPEGVFTVPGDGDVAYPPIFEALAESGYRGWLVVEAEQDPDKAHPFTYARKGFAAARAMAIAAGLVDEG
ncbi:MAG: myo-inosose-2 dehydratase [Pseudomonadota bacterium]